MYQKKEKIFIQKMSPHLSQLNIVITHRNYSRQNNLQILKLAMYAKIEDCYSECKLARMAKCSYFILFTQNMKFYRFVIKIKKFVLPI